MANKTLYFDESGYSGYNLLDPAVPFFTIASTDIPPAEADEILKQAFPRYQGPEVKFQNIWASAGHRARLPVFCKAIATRKGRGHSWSMDKKFVVLTKIVDFLCEPIIHAAGHDFYANGYAQKYANFMYHGLRTVGSEELFDSVIADYQAFSRNPSEETLIRFHDQLQLKASSTDGQVKDLLEMLVTGTQAFLAFHNLETFKKTNELYLTTMLSAVVDWRKYHDEDFDIVHDASSTFFRQRATWENITGADAPESVHQLGDGTSIKFPLRVMSTEAADSKDNRSVQLCDVLEGVVSKFFADQLSSEEEGVAREMLSSMVINGIFPDDEFPDGPPPLLDGPDAVDQMLTLMNRERSAPA